MKTAKGIGIAGLLLAILLLPARTDASTVRHMNLDALADNAGAIFRGTVTGIEAGTRDIGGKALPTTTYLFRVDELFKGEPTATRNGERYLAVTMIGSIKDEAPSGSVARFAALPDMPRFTRGGEYLLFTTRESSAGLSVTVGLEQGCFDLVGGMALNRAGNAGLFNGMAAASTNRGPIEYRELAERIRTSLGSQ